MQSINPMLKYTYGHIAHGSQLTTWFVLFSKTSQKLHCHFFYNFLKWCCEKLTLCLHSYTDSNIYCFNRNHSYVQFSFCQILHIYNAACMSSVITVLIGTLQRIWLWQLLFERMLRKVCRPIFSRYYYFVYRTKLTQMEHL